MNKKSNLVKKGSCYFYPSSQEKNEIYPLSGRFYRAQNLINRFENELKLHPVLYNNMIENLLIENGKEKTLASLDPEVYIRNFKINEDDEDDNKIITKLFESSESKSKKREIFSKTSLFSLKEKSESEVKIEPRKSKNDEKVKVYTKQHFEWLFNQEKRHELYKKLDMKYSEFYIEKDGKKEINLEKKIKEFCTWAELNYDCKELELDAITLMKIFLVNYDRGPLMWAPINLKEINGKEFKLNVDISNSSDTDSRSENSSIMKKKLDEKKANFARKIKEKDHLKSNFEWRNSYGKWYMPKKYWPKMRHQKIISPKNEIFYDNKTNSKLLKSNGIKLFRDFFFHNKNGRQPYFLEQNKKMNFVSKNINE